MGAPRRTTSLGAHDRMAEVDHLCDEALLGRRGGGLFAEQPGHEHVAGLQVSMDAALRMHLQEG